MKKKNGYKILSLFLVFTLILSIITLGPAAAYAVEETADINREIIAFEELAPEIAVQNVPLGTGKSGLVLPDTLTGTVKPGAKEISVTDSVYGSDGTGDGITEIPVQVTWISEPEYDGNNVGVYTFTAEISGFILSAAPPIITVTVYEGEAKGIITAFEELEEDVRWQNIREPMLPEKVKGTVEGRTTDIPVTWEADHEYNADSPEPGLYVFTAEIGGDYTLADGVEAPRITVYIPKARKMMLFMAGSAADNDPLVITTADQLAEVADLVNRGKLESFIFNDSSATVYLELGNDIDLSDYGSGNGWTPIGTNGNAFKSYFDGNNNSITGLKINRSGSDYMGLFGYIDGGTVKNVGVTNVGIYGKDYVGAVAGYVNKGTVEKCYSTGNVKGSGNNIGGVAGYVDNDGKGTIQNCYSSGSVTGKDGIGGVTGVVAHGTVQNCYSIGSVKGSGNNVGGIAGTVVDGSKVQSCAALNSFVSGTGNVGRVVGINGGTLSGNIAFAGMDVLLKGSPKTAVSDAGGIDGQSKTAADIKADGTIGGLFTSTGGWSNQNGKLPGLFGNTVDMPAYIEDKTSDPYFPGLGTSKDNPFQIATAEQLAKLAELVNAETSHDAYAGKYYRLTADIDLSAYGNGEGWVPIGTESKRFNGCFDGNNKCISGLMINRLYGDYIYYIGLFGYIEGGTVQNVGLTNVNILGADSVGAVVGHLEGGSTVQNCYSSGSVSALYGAGGVVGTAVGSTVQNCYSTASVRSDMSSTGGVVEDSIGSTVQNCAALNSSISGKYKGRIAGDDNGYSKFSHNYAFNGIPGSWGNKGLNKQDGEDVTLETLSGSSFWTTEANWDSSSPWDENVWTFADNKLPVLKGFEGQNDEFPFHISGFAGTGTSDDDPYLIKTAVDLAKLAELVNAGTSPYADAGKYYRLENDIDLSGYGKTYNGGRGWVPIGTESNPFKGIFIGNNKKISGLYINNSSLNYAGLFGYIDGGSVESLALSGVNINGGSYVGGLAGKTNGTVQCCYADGVVNGSNYVGGLVGHNENSNITNCYTTGTVSGSNYVGGVAGVAGGTIQYCYSTATVNGTANVGGVSGNVSGSVKNSVALNSSVNSSGNSTMGRVAGINGGSLVNNYSFSGMKVNGQTVSDGALNDINGEDISIEQIYDTAF